MKDDIALIYCDVKYCEKLNYCTQSQEILNGENEYLFFFIRISFIIVCRLLFLLCFFTSSIVRYCALRDSSE